MAGFRELLNQTKKEVVEVSPADAEARLGDAVFLDVRELDEYEQGMIPGATSRTNRAMPGASIIVSEWLASATP